MTLREASCPGCGATIRFENAATLYAVCASCQSASIRGDVKLELVGKVAAVAEIESPLALGARGKIDNVGFHVVGLVQLDHGAGPWNEWCISMGDGRWAWLAEAQGEYLFTTLRQGLDAPKRSKLRLEAILDFRKDGAFVVTEIGKGTVTAAVGELPFAVDVNVKFHYADLRGPSRGFGTLDYGSGDACEAIYLGKTLDFADLHLDLASAPRKEPPRVAAARIDCVNCGASIDVRDPKNSKRVACTSCGAILDPTSEKATVIELQKTVTASPWIPLGSKGNLEGHEYMVFAHLTRSVKVEGVRYPWDEYLLRRDDGAYHWLVCSSRHWSLVKPIGRGDVSRSSVKAVVKGLGPEPVDFKHFQSATARVDSVMGEVYWEVAVGETVKVHDYVAPPRMVSIEESESEVVCSIGEYLTPQQVTAAFRLTKALPATSGVGAQQPNPFKPRAKAMWRVAGWLFVATIAVNILLHLVLPAKIVFDNTLTAEREMGPGVGVNSNFEPPPFASEPFEIPRATGNVEVRLMVDTDTATWMGVEGSLVNSESGAVRDFNVVTEVADPGTRLRDTDVAYLGSVAGGLYTLRLQPVIEITGAKVAYRIELRRAVASHIRPWVVGLLLLTPAVILSLIAAIFEGQRWSESDHG